MIVSGAQVCIGRVLSEDDDFMLLEVIKNEERELTLNPDPESPDRFYTLLFVHSTEGGLAVWKPWEEDPYAE